MITVGPHGPQAFAADKGMAPYIWAISPNASGGTIDATGNYTAGSKAGVTDVVIVTDSLLQTGRAEVTITAGVIVRPDKASVKPLGRVTFTASGGSGLGYQWSVTSAPAHGTIDAQGNYTAGADPSVDDDIAVQDSSGNKGGAKVQPDQKLLFKGDWEKDAVRLKAVRKIASDLAALAIAPPPPLPAAKPPAPPPKKRW